MQKWQRPPASSWPSTGSPSVSATTTPFAHATSGGSGSGLRSGASSSGRPSRSRSCCPSQSPFSRRERWRRDMVAVGVLTAAAATLVLYTLLQAIAAGIYRTPLVPLTTARWFVARAWPAVATFVELLRVGTASIVLGAWWSASPHPDYVSWVVLLVTAGVVLAGVAAGREHERRVVLGFALVALGSYALIAAARGPGAERFWRRTPPEVPASLRYHYMAQAFLVAMLAAALAALARRVSPATSSAVAIGCSVLLLVGAGYHGVRVDLHDAARREIREKLGRLQAQIATTRAGETLHIENEPVAAFGWMPNSVIPLPGLAALYVIAFPPDQVDDARMRFVEHDPRELELFRTRGGRLGALLEQPAAGEGRTGGD